MTCWFHRRKLQPRRLIRSSSVRLASLQTLLFVIVFAIAGAGALVMVRRAEYRAAHAEIGEVEDDLSDILAHHGAAGLPENPGHRHDPGRDYRLEDSAGRLLAGGLPPPPALARTPPKVWITYSVPATADHAGGPVLALVHPEPGGLRLVIGEYLAVRARQDDGLLLGIIGLAGLVASLGLLGGVLVGRVQRRVDQIAAAVEAFAQGDRMARAPAPAGARSDHDQLAVAVDHMMEL